MKIFLTLFVGFVIVNAVIAEIFGVPFPGYVEFRKKHPRIFTFWVIELVFMLAVIVFTTYLNALGKI